ncbi:MAG: hypothetical protein FJW32_27625 [Acidobacteria bacterium]|nr:hypothetical protein [Acidobacteriota bacterium]
MRVFAALIPFVLIAGAQPPSEEARAYVKEMGKGEGTLQAGDVAPDFTLRKSKSEESVTLSALRGVRPVALLFGRYT